LVEAALKHVARIKALLSGAQADLAADRLTYPPGNNALEKYRAVLELEVDNANALSGLSLLLDRYAALIDEALTRTDLDRAQSLLDRARQVDAGSDRVQALAGRLEAARVAEQQAAERAREESERIARERELARTTAEAPRPSALPAVRDIHGWSASQVQGLQRETAAALGIADPLKVKDCAACPELVVIPAGRFTMGSPETEEGRWSDGREGPQRPVTIGRPLLVGKYEVTFAEWDACADEGACKRDKTTAKAEWGRGRQPVMNVSWQEIDEQYLPWLNRKSGLSNKPKAEQYRLLSESEWEYAARAGTTGPFSFEGVISPSKVNYDSNYTYGGSAKDSAGYRRRTVEVGSLAANRWGLHEMHGNVWEWVQDCWNDNYNGALADGSARLSGDCSLRVLRGGSWLNVPRIVRSANRVRDSTTYRNFSVGFRVARMLP
jgi:formylglycine-generating enzyme required for sulfatase activity